MVKTTIIKVESGAKQGYKYVETDRFEIEAQDQDTLLALFFREYDNRYKYCNDLSYKLADDDMQSAYNDWYSDINNYANNGGDMW
jgi:hypothetical protein